MWELARCAEDEAAVVSPLAAAALPLALAVPLLPLVLSVAKPSVRCARPRSFSPRPRRLPLVLVVWPDARLVSLAAVPSAVTALLPRPVLCSVARLQCVLSAVLPSAVLPCAEVLASSVLTRAVLSSSASATWLLASAKPRLLVCVPSTELPRLALLPAVALRLLPRLLALAWLSVWLLPSARDSLLPRLLLLAARPPSPSALALLLPRSVWLPTAAVWLLLAVALLLCVPSRQLLPRLLLPVLLCAVVRRLCVRLVLLRPAVLLQPVQLLPVLALLRTVLVWPVLAPAWLRTVRDALGLLPPRPVLCSVLARVLLLPEREPLPRLVLLL